MDIWYASIWKNTSFLVLFEKLDERIRIYKIIILKQIEENSIK